MVNAGPQSNVTEISHGRVCGEHAERVSRLNLKNTYEVLGTPTIVNGQSSPFFKIARMLVRLDQIASLIVNANDYIM